MPLGTGHTNSIPVTWFSLVAPSDFVECMVDLLAIQYTGQLSSAFDPNGNPQWLLRISGPPGSTFTAIQAGLGDVLVWNGNTLECMNQASFDANITPD